MAVIEAMPFVWVSALQAVSAASIVLPVYFAFSGRWFICVKSLALGLFRLQAGSDAPSRHDASTAVVTLDIALRPASRQYLGSRPPKRAIAPENWTGWQDPLKP